MMNEADIEQILQTPTGKLRAGRKRHRENLQQGSEGQNKEEVQVQKDIMKYSEKISEERGRIEKSLDSRAAIEKANERLGEDIEDETREILEQEKSRLKKSVLTSNEMKAAKEQLQLWEGLMESAEKQLKVIRGVQTSPEKKTKASALTEKLILGSVRNLDILRRENTLDAVRWVRLWKQSLETTLHSDKDKCAATLHKLDSSLKSTFSTIMEKSENRWINNNLASQGDQSYTYTTGQGIQYPIKLGQTYSPNFEILLQALLKEMLRNIPETTMIAQLEQHEYHEGADISVHIEKFKDLIMGYELVKGYVEESTKVQSFMKTIPRAWIDHYEVPKQIDLTGAINWAQERARERIDKMKFKRDLGGTDVLAPAVGEKFLMPTKQILETINAKITRKEFDSADIQSLKNMISGKNAVDKLGSNESDSDSEEPQRDMAKQKKRKQKKAEFVTAEDISALVNEVVINAIEARKVKWCSHCKYENIFDKEGKKKNEWHRFVAEKSDYENHYVGECKKKFDNGNFKKTGKWCGKCKTYEHAYSECKDKNLNPNRP